MTLYAEIPKRLYIKVTPNAKSAGIAKEVRLDGSWIFKIAVTTTPEKGKANKAVIDALAQELKVPKSCLTITHGLLSREKIIRVTEP